MRRYCDHHRAKPEGSISSAKSQQDHASVDSVDTWQPKGNRVFHRRRMAQHRLRQGHAEISHRTRWFEDAEFDSNEFSLMINEENAELQENSKYDNETEEDSLSKQELTLRKENDALLAQVLLLREDKDYIRTSITVCNFLF